MMKSSVVEMMRKWSVGCGVRRPSPEDDPGAAMNGNRQESESIEKASAAVAEADS